jgi:hypothetical protein
MTNFLDLIDETLELGLTAETRWFRADVSRGLELRDGHPQVDREAGIITGYAVLTKGPALGHHVQIDDTTLEQVVTLGNATTLGIKSRFDHPNASNTSMGTFLGRTKNFRRVGDRVLADLHLSKSAKEAPQGDLYTYVLGLAERDPSAFGASIVFEGEQEYLTGPNGERTKDATGQPLPGLARVTKLLASDVVDEPAANPDGFFQHGSSLASKITAFLNRWAQQSLLPQLRAGMALSQPSEVSMPDATATITQAQVELARAEGQREGQQAERARVAAVQKAFTAVWGDAAPAEERTVLDGCLALGAAAEDAEKTFKLRKLAQLAAAAPPSAGGGEDRTAEKQIDLSALPLEERVKAEWEQNLNGLRDEFAAMGAYLAFARAQAAGQVKILQK